MTLPEPMEVEEERCRGRQTRSKSRRQKLIEAIREDKRDEILMCILDKNFDLSDVPQEDKLKLFTTFMEEGYVQFIKRLYENKGADFVATLVHYGQPDDRTRTMRTLDAIWNLCVPNADNCDMIVELLKLGIPVDQQICENGPTLLLRAIINERADVVRVLLSLGADVNKKIPLFATPLFLASKLQDSSIAKILIEAGSNIHVGNEHKQNPIHVACSEGSVKNLHLLLHYGASINDLDTDGHIPFCYVKQKASHFLCLQIMIEHIALLTSQRATLHPTNLQIIANNPRLDIYYKQCLSELQIMKETNVYESITFFTVLTVGSKKLELLMKNRTFTKNFKMLSKTRFLPIYWTQMFARFMNAEKKHNVKTAEFKRLNKIFGGGGMPHLVVEKITSYLCYGELKRLDWRLPIDIMSQKVLTWPFTIPKM